MGRPKKETAKTKAIRVRMTEDEFLIVTILAEQCGITKSGLMMAGIHNLIRMLDDDDFTKLNEKLIRAKEQGLKGELTK